MNLRSIKHMHYSRLRSFHFRPQILWTVNDKTFRKLEDARAALQRAFIELRGDV